ncbi:hypothetical protein [Pseudovibrio exalbescens]|uniref:hypothetical protein n=1 Tax=Pseudovibrio exalbescens TaxID=197461 RepID=UPI000C9BC6E5|nr:hypothetical protein [Pseudovibrio exalbescens]
MTKEQHTPGPWQWVEEIDYGYGYTTLEGPDGQEVLTTGGINDGDEPITYMGDSSKPADLALIAAAPEMLAALKEIFAAVEDAAGHPDHCFIDLTVQQVDNIAGIIAKAKGE